MQHIRGLIAALALCACATAAPDWLTYGGDDQRSGWNHSESGIGKTNAGKIALLWKLKLDNAAKELNSLTAPVVVDRVFTARGVKNILVVAGASDNIFAIDAETGALMWKKTFQVEGVSKQTPGWLCPNALNATPVIEKGGVGRPNTTVFAIASDGKLHTLNVMNGEDQQPPIPFVPPFSKNWSLNLVNGVLYTATSQGCNRAHSGVYSMDLRDPKRPVRFFQAAPGGAGIWGRAGVAAGPDGRIYAETGDGDWDPAADKYPDSVLALSPKELKLLDYYTPVNRKYLTEKDLDMGNISPVLFPYKDRLLLAGAGKEGAIYLLDTRSLGGETHRTPIFRSPLYTNEDVDFAGRGFWGAFATYQDAQHARWLYAPAWGPVHSKAPAFPLTNGPAPNGSIMAFKVEEKDGSPVLTPAWISHDMDVPEPPIVANGVVFALSSGENVRQVDSTGRLFTSKERASTPHGNAVLYAFDAQTGKELYSSGKTMPAFTHFSGIAISSGRVYVSTYDSTVYSFGLKSE